MKRSMIYLLLVIGILCILYGWQPIKKKRTLQEETFREIIVKEEKGNGDYIKLLSTNHELKAQLSIIEDKIEDVLTQIENLQGTIKGLKEEKENKKENMEQVSQEQLEKDYGKIARNIQEMTKQNKSVEKIATTLNMGKGEVLFIRRLLEK